MEGHADARSRGEHCRRRPPCARRPDRRSRSRCRRRARPRTLAPRPEAAPARRQRMREAVVLAHHHAERQAGRRPQSRARDRSPASARQTRSRARPPADPRRPRLGGARVGHRLHDHLEQDPGHQSVPAPSWGDRDRQVAVRDRGVAANVRGPRPARCSRRPGASSCPTRRARRCRRRSALVTT